MLAALRGQVAGFGHGPRRHGIRVLTFHGVIPRRTDQRLQRNFHTESEFRALVARLRRCLVLEPEMLASAHAQPDGWARPPVVITFDDGYANNMVAAEILAQARLPWALFVSTGVLGTDRSLWTVELGLLLLAGEAGAVEAFGRQWSLADRPERETAHNDIRRRLKQVSAADRLQVQSELEAQFPDGEIDRLLATHGDFAMLRWDQVRELHDCGVRIGGHGVHHELHNPAQDRAVVEAEVAGSAAALAAELGTPPILFAYPDGQWTADSIDAVRASGYRAACTTVQQSVRPGDDVFALPRLDAPKSVTPLVRTLAWDQ